MPRKPTVLLLTLSLMLAALGPVMPVAAQGGPDYWPTDGWQFSTPEEQGMDSDKLADALAFLLEQDDYTIHSLTVVRNGYMVVDAYFYPFEPDALHDIASVTKSFTATLIGIAIQQGYLPGVEEPVLSFFIDREIANVDANKEAQTIKDLLTMRTGFACDASNGEITLQQMLASPEWVQFTLDLPMLGAPGEVWEYCSPGVHLLSAIVTYASGLPLWDFAQMTLFDPLGFDDSLWPADAYGYTYGWGDLRITPHDMAKLGFLYLNDGVWAGTRLLPEDWVATATSPAGNGTDHYGYLWWLENDGYSAHGRGGQSIFVIPEDELIVVTTAGGGNTGVARDVLDDFIRPAIQSNDPLPPNPDGYNRLQALHGEALQPVEVLLAEPQPIPPLPDIAANISGKTYLLEDNFFGLRAVVLSFDRPDEATLIVPTTEHPSGDPLFEWQIGLDGLPRITPGRMNMPAAAIGGWVSDDTFEIEIDEIGNNFCWRISLTFDGDHVIVTMQDLTGFYGQPLVIQGCLEGSR
ncbi:MAG: serine hydrolase [Anaerolineae bacterium]|nr:serine hydrolase [Anaerolineae bacterium]